MEVSASLIRDASGEGIGFRGITRDVTQRKKQEEEILKIKKIESLGLLAGGIAHDFNNILTAIVGNISLAKNSITADNDAHDMLNSAEKASLRARDLTQQLLTFSRGGAPIKKITTIRDILVDTVDFVLRGSNVSPQFELDDDLHNVEIDPGQISQVIHNLTINALQAMPEGGTITVTAKSTGLKNKTIPLPKGDYIMISITDQGKGIPEKDMANIFDPYFTTKKDGTGLGLTISYSIIKNHGGYIKVKSEVSHGTTFTMYLPASEKTINNHVIDPICQPEPETTIRGKILIMDDDKMVIDTTGMMLKNMGYSVDFTSNGNEAIEVYKAAYRKGEPYVLVIMDLTIPGSMGGKEAISVLREFDPGIRAIVSSGYSNDPVMAQYREHGFCGVIVKPYTLNDLRLAITQIIG